jgi:hypothetical protein
MRNDLREESEGKEIRHYMRNDLREESEGKKIRI